MFVSMLLGGQVVYTGKNINAAHEGARARGLRAEHLDAFLKDFRSAIDEVGVAPDKAEKLMTLLERQRAAVLGHLTSSASTRSSDTDATPRS